MTTISLARTLASAPCAFCPSCGLNLAAEQPIAVGPLEIDPRGEARWFGRRINCTAAQFQVLGALVQARGRIVSKDVLAERVGYESDGDSHNLVQVLLCRLRGHLRQVGAPPTMIVLEWGRGYRFDADLVRDFQKDVGR